MHDSADPIARFVTAARHSFAFLSDWNFQICATPRSDDIDPRDRSTTVRFFSENRIIDINMGYIVCSLFIIVYARAETDNIGDCSTWRPKSYVSFEEYLLAKHRRSISVPLPGMGRHVVFFTLSESHPQKYIKLIAPNIEKAVEILAVRFKQFGGEIIRSDVDKISRELQLLCFPPKT